MMPSESNFPKKTDEEILRRQANNLKSLYEMMAVISQTSSVDEVYDAALNSVQATMLAERASILLFDQKGVLRFKAWCGLSETYRTTAENRPIEVSNKNNPRPFPVANVRQEPALASMQDLMQQENIEAALFIPLAYQGRTLGMFTLYYDTPHKFTSEDIQLAQTIAHYITFAVARQKSEEELHLQSSALNAAANAIVITNIDGNIEWVNPAFSELTGYTLEEAINKNPRELIRSGEHEKVFYKNLWQTVLSGKVWRGEVVNRRKDGSLYNEEQTITPLKDAEGKITHFISIKQDISQRKQTEKIVNQWLAEQNTLHQVSQSLLSVNLNPDRIYTTLHDAVMQIMPCDVFVIVLDDKKNEGYHAVYLYDRDQRYPPLRIPRGSGLSGKVITSGETIFIHDDLESDTPAVHFGSSAPVRSILAVPLRKNKLATGMVSVQSYQPNVYNERHRVLLETLAAQITTIIENASLFYETRQRLIELELLYESGLALNQFLEPKELGEKIIELLEQKLGWHHITIRLTHPQDDSLELLAFSQPGLKDEAEYRKVEKHFQTLISRIGQGLSGWSIQNKKPVRSNDLSHDPRYVDTYPGLQSGLYVPMKLGDRVIGVISIESEQPNAFSEADERLAVTLANQAASAIENARLFEAERKQHQMSDALRDALQSGASMSISLDFDTILDRLLEALERVVPFDGGSIMVFENKRVKIARVRGYKMLEKQIAEVIAHLSFDIDSIVNLRQIVTNKQPMIIPDVWAYSDWVKTPESNYVRSWAGAPIIVNGEVIALFSLDSTQPNFFTEEHAQLLQAFTGQASLALQNASLYNETAQRAREFVSLYETSKILSAETDLNTLVQNIVDHARKMLSSNSSGIYLYHADQDELELMVITESSISPGVRLRVGEGVAGLVAKTLKPIRIDDYSTWGGRSSKYENLPEPIHAVLEVPMLYGGELVGVLTADEVGESERKFTDADERLLTLFASQAAGAIHSARLREQTERRIEQLQALHTIDRAISSSFDLHLILNTVISQTISQLGVDAVNILLFNPYLQTLEYVAGQGFRTRNIEQSKLRFGEGLAGRVALTRTTIHVPDLQQSDFTRTALLAGEGFVEYYGAPLIAKGEIKGVLEVYNRSPLYINSEWRGFLETLAGQAAITIDQTQLFDDLQRVNLELIIAYDTTIEGWSHAMDLRDEETEGHTRRVTEMTLELASAMGVSDDQMLHIKRGALLHDIGKMGIPDRILLKEEKLTNEEWVIMRQHPNYAHDMLQPIKYLQKALDIPYCHHEKWDGSGYPRGLKGEQIPFAARIFAIIDVWDAVTIDRPYRKAWTKRKALQYIRSQSGKHFDPNVVKAFLEVFEYKGKVPRKTKRAKK